jgi:hypothetical protein
MVNTALEICYEHLTLHAHRLIYNFYAGWTGAGDLLWSNSGTTDCLTLAPWTPATSFSTTWKVRNPTPSKLDSWKTLARSRKAGRRARRWWCFVVVQSDTFWFLACLVDGHRIYRSATMTYFGTSVVELLCAVEIKQGRRFVHWCNCFPSQWLIHEFCNELGWFCKSLFGDCWLLIKRTHFWSSMLIASI